MRSEALPSARFLALFYFVSLGGLGAMVPLLGARMESVGLRGHALGVLMAMFPVGRLLASPLWAHAADRWRVPGLLLRVGCGLSFVGAVLLARADGALSATLALLLFSIGRVPQGPLVDAVILEVLSAPGADTRDYGRIRLWGSAGFLAMTLLAGWLATHTRIDPMQLCAALFALTWAGSFRFKPRGAGGPAPLGPALRVLVREPGLGFFLLFASLQALQLSIYDTFYSVHVRSLGLPAWVTTYSVAAGVTFEVVVMAFGRPMLARLGTSRALLLAAALSVPRWWLTATVHSPGVLVLTQTLHAITFGLFWLASVQWMAARAPRAIASSAQSLFTAVSYGFGSLAGALLAGRVRESHGTAVLFELLAGLAVAGTASAALTGLRMRSDAALEQQHAVE